jgi:hypothetical protein
VFIAESPNCCGSEVDALPVVDDRRQPLASGVDEASKIETRNGASDGPESIQSANQSCCQSAVSTIYIIHCSNQPMRANRMFDTTVYSTGTSWHSGHSQTGRYAIRDNLKCEMLKFETVEGDIDRHDVEV